ncbi:hypothetical protein CDE51_12255, partial [Pasteurella multocida]
MGVIERTGNSFEPKIVRYLDDLSEQRQQFNPPNLHGHSCLGVIERTGNSFEPKIVRYLDDL